MEISLILLHYSFCKAVVILHVIVLCYFININIFYIFFINKITTKYT